MGNEASTEDAQNGGPQGPPHQMPGSSRNNQSANFGNRRTRNADNGKKFDNKNSANSGSGIASSNDTQWRRPNRDSRNENNSGNTQRNEPKRFHNNTRGIGFLRLKELVENPDTNYVILELCNDRTGFGPLLDNKLLSDDMIILIVRLMANICNSSFNQNKILLLTKILQSRFIEKLTVYITSLINQSASAVRNNKFFWNDPDLLWNSIIIWCKTVNQLLPSYSDNIKNLLTTVKMIIKAIEEMKNMHFSDSIHTQINDLLTAIDKTISVLEVKRQIKETVTANNDIEPPDDFRDIPVIPSARELTVDAPVFLRQNIVQGSFNDVNHYLDIQFRLLREDFVAPLRRGIVTYLRNQTRSKEERRKLDDIKVYEFVKFLSFQTVNELLCYKICFNNNFKKPTNISYENSKRFMFGSLVCFTNDNFKTILFGKIVERDIKLLQQGMVVVGFEENIEINLNQNYVMVESTVYFEPYYRVLTVLQEMNTETFPMERYIIYVETLTNPPQYLQTDNPVNFIIDGKTVPASNIPSIDFYGLNEAQLIAFRAAIMNEFSIIQGPPGTGKTFLGLKIAGTLIKNKVAWYARSPMLVICYTNHALDQFLEGLIPVVGNKMLRVGSRSKNEALNEYNLAVKRRDEMSECGAVYQKRKEWQNCLEELKKIDDLLKRITANQEIISFDSFCILKDYNNSWFAEANDKDICVWLLEGKYQIDKSWENANLKLSLQEDDGKNDNNDEIDYFEDRENEEIEEQIRDFDKVNTDTKPLASINKLTKWIQELHINLNQLVHEQDDVNVIFEREELEHLHWEAQTDLHYIQSQLRLYQDSRIRVKPDYVDLKNPYNMGYEDRWKLYFHWVDQYVKEIRHVYDNKNIKFRNLCRQYSELREIDDTQLMRNHLVVGMTTTCAARLQTSLIAIRPRVVIVEEAAEILESHIIAALTDSCQQLILIGDHLQLKPGASDYKIERDYKLGVSLFERMVKNNIKCHTLNVQHRMRPELSRLIKPHIYPHLEDHESTLEREKVLGVESSLFFIDHRKSEEICQDSSKKNVHESKFLVALARHLILNGYKSEQITILAAYLGQFYEMRREKMKHRILLQDVRISVLDNYQGEESDIILLSLVRNNKENKPGFLRIQNRVCVALSRARNGMFIMGNMELLLNSNSENKIWENVKKELDEQNAIGSHLSLRCQVHPDRVIKVSEAEDFYKISEGGCDLLCNSVLNCGHNCKSLCHILNRDHAKYECMENCVRLLCTDADHQCPKKCYEDCGPCKYIVARILPGCGHTANIFCYIDVNKYKCLIEVDSTLPCGHKALKPCHHDLNSFLCPHPCDTRVEPCGHQCNRKCHIRLDPDHLEYKCHRLCGKPRIDCSNIEDPHICAKLCFQECEECNVDVPKFRSCGHRFKVPCKLKIEEVNCEKRCKITLPCGHICKGTCSEPCPPCKLKVKKTIPDCNHSVKIQCSAEPTRSLCSAKECSRLLACGHPCTNPCKMACTTECKELVDCSIESPCGHVITKVDCYLKNAGPDNRNLLKLCNRRCDTELKCGHKCKGTCGKCRQSRIHMKCAEKCEVPLVCNHLCPIPCREACKPCNMQCELKCAHSKCKKKCGELCTPCKERCTRRCEHVKCSNFCGMKCNVDPCEKRCLKKIKCGHPCVGFCGDPCPPLCRLCHKDELTEIFFGSEDEENAIFVQLNDCGHIFEHKGLEQWLDNDKDKIQFKKCPRCTVNITTTHRYSSYFKEAISDVFKVKKEAYGKTDENDNFQRELLKHCEKLFNDFENKRYLVKPDYVLRLLGEIKQRLQPIRGKRRQSINKIELNAIKSKMQFLQFICEIFNSFFKDSSIILRLLNLRQRKLMGSLAGQIGYSQISHYLPPICEMINNQMQLLIRVLGRSIDHYSEQENVDVELEIRRLRRILEYMQIFDFDEDSNEKLKDDDVKKIAFNIKESLLLPQRYSDARDEEIKANLTQVAKKISSRVIISEQERIEIVKAVGLAKGHWYKCPNGHPYAIGECGGANQIGRCFCGAQIGGAGHRLLTDNQHAPEMDGSTRHVWPGSLY